jgi:SAM-dependent methyltransferase
MPMRTRKDALLHQGLEHALANRPAESAWALSALHALLDVRTVPEDLHYLLFATAISRRFAGATSANSSPWPDDGGARQIDLFQRVMTHLPLASTADAVANTVLGGLLRGHEEATLLDVGIGQGRQVRGLLRLLAREGALPSRLTVVGVDPCAASLGVAEASVAEAAREVGATVRFMGWVSPVESLPEATWAALREVPRPLVVNAAFTLHHVAEAPGGTGEARDAVLRRLRVLRPEALVLCEPHVDHHRAPVRERFLNAWNHFTRVLGMLDTLEVPREERVAIRRFFGREIEDVVGTVDEAARSARHELAASWMERLRRAGFEPLEGLEQVRPEVTHPAVGLRAERGCVGICHGGDMLMAVLAVRPGERG